MNETQHLSSQFEAELTQLRSAVLQMGGLVENQLSAAIEAYSSGEVGAVKQIVETDRVINDLEKAIDDDCAHLIAKRQPTASDLRMVFGVSKLVTDLERAGDEKEAVAHHLGFHAPRMCAPVEAVHRIGGEGRGIGIRIR